MTVRQDAEFPSVCDSECGHSRMSGTWCGHRNHCGGCHVTQSERGWNFLSASKIQDSLVTQTCIEWPAGRCSYRPCVEMHDQHLYVHSCPLLPVSAACWWTLTQEGGDEAGFPPSVLQASAVPLAHHRDPSSPRRPHPPQPLLQHLLRQLSSVPSPPPPI